MTEFKNLIESNYKSIIDRGLITPITTREDFINKLDEEVGELYHADNEANEIEEIADVILTALNMARHFDVDIVKAMEDKIIINKKRADEGI